MQSFHILKHIRIFHKRSILIVLLASLLILASPPGRCGEYGVVYSGYPYYYYINGDNYTKRPDLGWTTGIGIWKAEKEIWLNFDIFGYIEEANERIDYYDLPDVQHTSITSSLFYHRGILGGMDLTAPIVPFWEIGVGFTLDFWKDRHLWEKDDQRMRSFLSLQLGIGIDLGRIVRIRFSPYLMAGNEKISGIQVSAFALLNLRRKVKEEIYGN